MRESWALGAVVGLVMAMILGRCVLGLTSFISIARVSGAGVVIGAAVVWLNTWLAREKGQR